MAKENLTPGDASSAATLTVTAEKTLQSQTYFQCAKVALRYAFYSWPGFITTIIVGCMIFLTDSILHAALIQALNPDAATRTDLTMHDIGIELAVDLLCLAALTLLLTCLHYFTILTVIGRVQPSVRAGLTTGSLAQTLLNLFVFNGLFLLLAGVGTLLLLVPGILVCLYFCHGPAMVVAVPCGPVAALKRSKQLSRGRLGGVLKFSLIVFMLCCMLQCVVVAARYLPSMLLEKGQGDTIVVVATGLVTNYVAGGMTVFSWAAFTALYLRYSEAVVELTTAKADL